MPRRWRKEDWKRWERGAAMELWQLDVLGGFHLADLGVMGFLNAASEPLPLNEVDPSVVHN
jgi:hypothetical protein